MVTYLLKSYIVLQPNEPLGQGFVGFSSLQSAGQGPRGAVLQGFQNNSNKHQNPDVPGIRHSETF